MLIAANILVSIVALAAYGVAAVMYMMLQAWSHPAESNSQWTDIAFVLAALFLLVGTAVGIWLTWRYTWWVGLIAGAAAIPLALVLHAVTELARQVIRL